MPVCTFCKQGYEFPKGITVVQKDGVVRYFCCSKCRKNSEMGRDSKKVKWVRKSEIAKAEKAKKEVVKQERLGAKDARIAEKKARQKKVVSKKV